MASTIMDKTALPFDGTDAGEVALEMIAPLLRAVGGTVHIIMVLDQYVQNELTEFAATERLTLERAARISCERLASHAETHSLEAGFRVVDDAEVVEGVLGEAKAAGCTAIALPTHGAHAVTRWLMGNLRDKIVQGAGMPVLVLPPAD